MGHACGEPNETELTAAHGCFTTPCTRAGSHTPLMGCFTAPFQADFLPGQTLRVVHHGNSPRKLESVCDIVDASVYEPRAVQFHPDAGFNSVSFGPPRVRCTPWGVELYVR